MTNGYLPNWLRIPGTQFVTNSVTNPGTFTVVSSPNEKNIILVESVTDETSQNVKFIKFDLSGAEPQTFLAYRKNFIILAVITRTLGFDDIYEADILDQRDKVVYNFIESGCEIIKLSDTEVEAAEGSLFVGDEEDVIEATEPHLILDLGAPPTIPIARRLIPNATNYAFINKDGNLETNTSEPTEYHLMLAEIRTDATTIVSIEDKRSFIPIAWNNKYAGGGSGETGYPAVIMKFMAGEDISQYSCVYPSASDTVRKASASSKTTLPAIAIAIHSTLTGQINNFVVFGEISNPAWSWTPKEELFVNTSTGGLARASDLSGFSTGAYIQRVAVAISATKILVNPDLIIIKKDTSAEVPLLVMRDTGDIEIIASTDKINTDRSSFLAPLEITNTPTFKILPGRYFIDDIEDNYFSGITLDLSSGLYQTSAISPNYYKKIYFTINKSNVVKMYEGRENVSIPSDYPIIPSNELPICVVTVQDSGVGGAGTIKNISQDYIEDKRNWLNLGNLENISFKPVYKDPTTLTIQRGEGWFSNRYYTLSDNTDITATLTSLGTYYIYLNTTPYDLSPSFIISVSSSDILFTTTNLNNIDKRLFIPLGAYDVIFDSDLGQNIIDKSTFFSFKSKFWHYRDKPYSDEQTFAITIPSTVFTVTNFTFLSTDYLKVEVNGVSYYEIDDFTKDPGTNSITFNATLISGKLKIRKE